MKKLKYICRKDYKYDHGYVVRVPKDHSENPKNFHSKNFADGIYGGKNKAKKAAIAYRDKYLEETGQSYLLEKKTVFSSGIHGRIRKRDVRNQSGIIGIRHEIKYQLAADGFYYENPIWRAEGCKEGQKWSKTFTIRKWGEKGAFKLACEARYEQHGILSLNGKISDLPCRPPVPFEKIKK